MKERKNKTSSFSVSIGGSIPVEFVSNISHKVGRGKGNLEDAIVSVVKTNDKSQKINPLFLSQMMGFPVEWIKTPFENRKQI